MAYALGPVGPEHRQARIFVRRRARRGRIIVAVLLVMSASAGSFWFAYRTMRDARPAGEIPIIRADEQPTRKKPTDPGGISVPGQGSLVLNGPRDSKVEQLLPPPEAPLPRPRPEPASIEPPAQAALSAPVGPGSPAVNMAPSVAVPSPPRHRLSPPRRMLRHRHRHLCRRSPRRPAIGCSSAPSARPRAPRPSGTRSRNRMARCSARSASRHRRSISASAGFSTAFRPVRWRMRRRRSRNAMS
jgi:hypothetical protein